MRGAIGDEVGLGQGEEGAQKAQALAEHALGPHAGEPRRAAAGQEAHQHGLGLIVAGMGREDAIGADALCVMREKPVARGPRFGLDAALAPGRVPGQDGVRQPEFFREWPTSAASFAEPARKP